MGPSSSQLTRDVAVAVGLVVALALVYGMDKAPARKDNSGASGVVIEETPATVPPAKPLRLAVTPTHYDDMGSLLDRLGEAYRYTPLRMDELLDAGRLADFDVVFLTCGPWPGEWGEVRGGAGDRPGTQQGMVQEEKLSRLKANVRRYVEAGGTLYASDWRFQMVAEVFPELVDVRRITRGKGEQDVRADVVDDGLRDAVGAVVPLRFDLGAWFPAAFTGREVIPLMKGRFTTMDGLTVEAPLLVKFPAGKGTVIFTSFHNEKQNSETETALLRYLVFSALTARGEAQAVQTMVKGGFSPQKRTILSASPGNPSVTKRYQCTKTGSLQFALTFGQGALLQLTVIEPNGNKHDQRSTSAITIDIPNASPGEYQYTVTALQVPYPEFPFNLTIGQK